MADISLMGATFYGVPAVELPTAGGGTSTFYEVGGSETFTQNGTYDVSALAQAVVNVAGGGGSTKLVQGKFTGTAAQAGLSIDIDLPYTGSGYPIIVAICPTEGPKAGSGDFAELIQRYVSALFIFAKGDMTVAPTYISTGAENAAYGTNSYKSSATSATSQQNAAITANCYNDTDAGTTSTSIVKIRSNKKMAVRIASTSHGFAAGIEYSYTIVYSS